MSAKILYLSSYHPVLEYDDLDILNRVGATWFSTGIFADPNRPLNITHLNLRKPFFNVTNEKLLGEYYSINPNYLSQFNGLSYPKPKLTKSFVNNFDAIIAVHIPSMLDNWEAIKHKPIIIRTCGNTHAQEALLKTYADKADITFVRICETESRMQDYNGGTVIHCPINEDIYKDWKGEDLSVLSFQSHFKERRQTEPVSRYLNLIKPFKKKIYGAHAKNFKDPLVTGTLSWSEQVKQYQDCRVYFSISNGMAPLTYNFAEALMTGIPVVTFGEQVGNSLARAKGCISFYAVPSILENEVDGFYSDSEAQLQDYIRQLLNDKALAETISKNARKKALKLYGMERVTADWLQLLKKVGLSL